MSCALNNTMLTEAMLLGIADVALAVGLATSIQT